MSARDKSLSPLALARPFNDWRALRRRRTRYHLTAAEASGLYSSHTAREGQADSLLNKVSGFPDLPFN